MKYLVIFFIMLSLLCVCGCNPLIHEAEPLSVKSIKIIGTGEPKYEVIISCFPFDIFFYTNELLTPGSYVTIVQTENNKK